MLAAHCTPAYRFKGGVPALGESPAPLVRVRAHIELERKRQAKIKISGRRLPRLPPSTAPSIVTGRRYTPQPITCNLSEGWLVYGLRR